MRRVWEEIILEALSVEYTDTTIHILGPTLFSKVNVKALHFERKKNM